LGRRGARELVNIGFFEIFATLLAAIYGFVRDYGLAIILLTAVVRLVLLPLGIKQTKSMREMQRIQPEMRRIQQKHKGDRQKLNEEMMQLYKEHGVNPFGGCAPLLLQFPVLIALYWVIRRPLAYLQHVSDWALPQDLTEHPLAVQQWLGMRLDCSATTALGGRPGEALDVVCGTGVISVIPYIVLIGIMGFTTYYQQKQMQTVQGANNPQAAQMQMLTRIMPLFLIVIGWSFPAALVLYWTVTNLWTIGQQRLILGRFPPVLPSGEEPAAQSKGSSRPLKSGPKSTASKPSGKGRSGSDGRKAPATSSPSAKKKRRR
jgi:YidC/Oxa1 family membrane protein insertase